MLGNEVTPFSIPGDSRSLVFRQDTGVVVGIVTDIVLQMVTVDDHATQLYISEVFPVWEFFDWICGQLEWHETI